MYAVEASHSQENLHTQSRALPGRFGREYFHSRDSLSRTHEFDRNRTVRDLRMRNEDDGSNPWFRSAPSAPGNVLVSIEGAGWPC